MAERNDIVNFSNDYIDLMETSLKVSKEFKNEHMPCCIIISTITMIADLKKEISISDFKECPTWTTEALGLGMEIGTKENNKKVKRTFFNQITIRYKDHISQKSIKIFSNGRLQMTGITSVHEAKKIVTIVSGCLAMNSKVYKPVALDLDNILQIAMINSNFCLNHGLNIVKLQNCIMEHKANGQIPDHVVYEPDVYPGLKIKYKGTHLFVFSTGNVVITGAKSIENIKNSYTYINNILLNNWDYVKSSFHTKLFKSKSKNEYINGYPVSVHNACLSVTSM